MAKEVLADLIYAQMLKALKQTFSEVDLLIQDFVEENKDNLVLKELSTITVKKQKINKEDNKEDKKEDEKPIAVNKEEKTIKIKNLVNKTDSEINKILNPLETDDLKNILKNDQKESNDGI